jgi:hypothetical protein
VDKAVSAAFKAAQEAIIAQQGASEKAILKSEQAQKETNQATYVSIDGLNAEMRRITEQFKPRGEADALFKAIAEKDALQQTRYENEIRELRERIGKIENVKVGQTEQRSEHREVSSTALAVIGALVAVALLAMAFLSYTPKP